MCTFIADSTMLGWLQHQHCIVDAWREELLRRGDAETDTVTRIERHHDWLISEIHRLEHRCQADASK